LQVIDFHYLEIDKLKEVGGAALLMILSVRLMTHKKRMLIFKLASFLSIYLS